MTAVYTLIEQLRNRLAKLDPFIEARIDQHFQQLQAAVKGRQSVAKKSDLPTSGIPTGAVMEVIGESANNDGLYRWTGSAWQKSPFDPAQKIAELTQATEQLTDALHQLDGLSRYEPASDDNLFPVISGAFPDETQRVILGVTDDGQLHFDPTAQVARQVLDKAGFPTYESAGDRVHPLVAGNFPSGVRAVLGVTDSGEIHLDTTASAADRIARKSPLIAYLLTESQRLAAVPSVKSYTPDHQDAVLPLIVGTFRGNLDRAILSMTGQGELVFEPSDALLERLRDRLDLPEPDNSAFDGLNLANERTIYHIHNDGQSQSLGWTSVPPITVPGHTDGYLMANGGLHTLSDFFPLTPAGEQTYAPVSGAQAGESHASGLITGVIDWLKHEKGIHLGRKRCRFSSACSGVGGTAIYLYVEGGNHYHRFFTQVLGLYEAAKKQGYDFKVMAFTWTLGGTDMNNGTSYTYYYDSLKNIRAHREERLSRELGYAVDLHCILWQNGYRIGKDLAVPNAQWNLSRAVDKFHLACPYYLFKFNDAYHLTNISSKLAGRYLGRVYREVVLLRKTWKPLQPYAIKASGRIITAQFDVPSPPLVFDRDRIKAIEHEGFLVSDDSGNVPIIEVTLASSHSVAITVGRNLAANPRLTYAHAYTNSGYPPDGDLPRGTLRDSDTEIFYENQVSPPLAIPMHNYCLTFDEPITT